MTTRRGAAMNGAMPETVLTNAQIVLSDTVARGTLVVRDGLIAALDHAAARSPGALDCEGDLLLPGLVDLHTDNLERQTQPRANARFPSRSALLAHDAQCAAAGITTVLDALCIGDIGLEDSRAQTARDGVADLTAFAGTGLLRADHYLHLRCELPAPDLLQVLDTVAHHPLVRLVSLMDHTPGVGQNTDLGRYRAQLLRGGLAAAEAERHIATLTGRRDALRTPNRRALLARIAAYDVALASHDDQSAADIEEAAADGITIAEFPVTLAAAAAAHARGMAVVAGAPNLVRGGSHSGNVAAADLLRAEALDAFASDYVPAALLEAAFRANGAAYGAADRASDRAPLSLPHAIASVTAIPAALARLPDRGRLAPGLRADLVRVRLHEDLPVIRAVWREGERVA